MELGRRMYKGVFMMVSVCSISYDGSVCYFMNCKRKIKEWSWREIVNWVIYGLSIIIEKSICVVILVCIILIEKWVYLDLDF